MEAALALVAKYAQYIPLIVEAGGSVVDAFNRLKQLVAGAEDGTITPDEIAAHRQALDDLIADFNTPIED